MHEALAELQLPQKLYVKLQKKNCYVRHVQDREKIFKSKRLEEIQC